MKILVLNGSPNKEGNTALAISSFLDGFVKDKDTIKRYELGSLKYTTCIGCNQCYKTGLCIFKDDLEPLYKDYDEADFTLVASPIYFFTVSAFLKSAIDRTQAFWASKYILKKPTIDRTKVRHGIFIATGGASKDENFPEALSPVLDMYFKSINTKLLEELIIYETDKKKLINRPDDLRMFFNKGEEYRTLIEKT
jgi:multimeric flavodoxin WrbA